MNLRYAFETVRIDVLPAAKLCAVMFVAAYIASWVFP